MVSLAHDSPVIALHAAALIALAPTTAHSAPPSPAIAAGTTGAVSSEVSEASSPRPPRIDGGYFGLGLAGAATTVRVQTFAEKPLAGFEAALRVGDAVLPWLTIGFEVVLGQAWNSHQRAGHGGLMVELGILPIPQIPLSLRAGFGFGAGALHDDRERGRDGFGGALFNGSLRYEFFPGASRRRAHRGGGFVVGPELGWTGFPPSSAGQPMSNSFSLGLWIGAYLGS